MVERPIKKSERQATAASNDAEVVLEVEASPTETNQDSVTDSPENQSPEKRNIPRPLPAKEKDKGKEKGRGREKERESSRPPLNPALARGPKPSKPKPPVVQATQETPAEDLEVEADAAATAEG